MNEFRNGRLIGKRHLVTKETMCKRIGQACKRIIYQRLLGRKGTEL